MTQHHVTETAGEFRHWYGKDFANALEIAAGSSTRISRALGLRTMYAFQKAQPGPGEPFLTEADHDRWAKLMAYSPEKTWDEIFDLLKRSSEYTPAELCKMLQAEDLV